MAKRPVHALLALLFMLGGAGLQVDSSAAAPAPVEISAAVSAGALTYGSATTVTGRISQGGQTLDGAGVELQAAPYPYKGFLPVARATSASDGSFAFAAVRL